MATMLRLLSRFLTEQLRPWLIIFFGIFFPSWVNAQHSLEITVEELQFKHQLSDIDLTDAVDTRKFKTLVALNCHDDIGLVAAIITVIPANSIVDNRTEKVAWNSNDPSLSHVGIVNNSLWIMVGYKDYLCFVRASRNYLSPVVQDSIDNCDYTAPHASQHRLGAIPLDRATILPTRFENLKKALKLPGGQLYIDADLDVDADGSPRAKLIDPIYGQESTSLEISGKPVDAESVPYFVLPGNNPRAQDRFYYQMGFRLGDIGAVIYEDRVEFAIFADVGPKEKIGEGSVFLKRSLLNKTPTATSGLSVEEVKRITSSGIGQDVIYIVFPNSRPSDLASENLVETIRAKGKELFRDIGGNIQ